ncbi:MAG: hypothetical protein KGH64_00030 [Candidatus Micrarchaeota archaeon]|nr:hypothetical protein [Candidatus Micrarchaeota archaeon]MDE1833703.1 hypothetical protein [Candidatus Micrarchaeota archaeon]MDE1859767.1 hypothetical protein [Candidatus Micrarchaeota archaeon]
MNVVANYSNKGQTVYLSKGSTLTVVLDGSYWRIYNASNSSVLQQANSSVLQQVGKVGYGSGECSGFQPPGSGCGTVTKTFLSVGIGTANITAYRGSCGEALRCVNGTGNYSVRVVVTG